MFLPVTTIRFSGEGFSSHWVPYWRQCTPCNFNYHMIGKLETAMDDFTVSAVIHSFNITKLNGMPAIIG